MTRRFDRSRTGQELRVRKRITSRQDVIASVFCEAIPTFAQRGDCFVAKNAPRNDTIGELTYLQTLSEADVEALRVASRVHDVLTKHLAAQLQSLSGVTQIGVFLLTVHQQLIGAMAVGSACGLTQADMLALAPFADQAAVAIANARHFAQLQGPIQLGPPADVWGNGRSKRWIAPANGHGNQTGASSTMRR